MLFIGDVHARFDDYLGVISGHETSCQVGDFGAGFADLPRVGPGHRFIRGNHDDPAICRQSPNWIPDGTMEEGVLFVGGAFSVDRHLRISGRDWWPDEELGYQELWAVIDLHAAHRPGVVVSHDCPLELVPYLFGRAHGKSLPNRTNQALQALWDQHRPAVWIFGHWHRSLRRNILGCEFICLAELEALEVDVAWAAGN